VDSTAARVVSLARSLLATPYRYAGSDPKGFDCSGLTSYVFEKVGLSLPRTAQTQAAAGRWVAPDELASGDLVFFGEDRTKPYHVGVVVSEPGEPLTMIHASSSRGVTETAVLTNSYWLPRLRFGRRVLAAD
jgi:cell wall-associated NlpC family hydrolase